jgi:histidine triad (HIT) family protein
MLYRRASLQPEPPMSTQCTFCDLIQGAAEVSVCHEDADSIAFMDIQPVNAGHVLVVPRAHYNSLLDVPPEIGLHLFHVTMRLAGAIRRVTGCDDMNIVVNSGAAAGQDEPHYHVHIIPRRENDGFNIDLPFGGSAMPKRTLLDAMAAQLIAAMRDPMKTGSSGGRESKPLTKTMPEVPAPKGAKRSRAAAPDREVSVRRAIEGVSTGDPGERGVWRVEEGPHGELVYEKRESL